MKLSDVREILEADVLVGQDKIGVRVGKVLGKCKVAKNFGLDMPEARLSEAGTGHRL